LFEEPSIKDGVLYLLASAQAGNPAAALMLGSYLMGGDAAVKNVYKSMGGDPQIDGALLLALAGWGGELPEKLEIVKLKWSVGRPSSGQRSPPPLPSPGLSSSTVSEPPSQ
jgi:hypothetical protein